MYDKALSKDLFMLKYYHDRYKTQEICDKAVDDFLPALKYVSYWFVTGKIVNDLIKILIMSHFLVMKWVLV